MKITIKGDPAPPGNPVHIAEEVTAEQRRRKDKTASSNHSSLRKMKTRKRAWPLFRSPVADFSMRSCTKLSRIRQKELPVIRMRTKVMERSEKMWLMKLFLL